MEKRKIQTVQDIIVNEAIGFSWLMLVAYIFIMACVGVWYRWPAIINVLGV